MKEAAACLLRASFSKDAASSAETIVSTISGCFPSDSTPRLIHAWKSKGQKSFHMARIAKLPSLWRQLLAAMSITLSDPLLGQTSNQKIFDSIMIQKMAAFVTAPPSMAPPMELTDEEENALRYAAGYVPYKLLKRYEGNSERSAEIYRQCLQSMEVQDEVCVNSSHQDHSYTFGDYTTVWLETVNRGGLFKIADVTYRFFYSIELKVRATLPQQLLSQSSTKEAVVAAVENDDKVQHLWEALSSVIDDSVLASSLLHKIVILWVTMRGFSLCSAWLEEYKAAKSKSTKKRKRLRKAISNKN
eukprot:m.140398 g.140398  ORF g.140398 m.140398 type:complete len:302 (+) comp38303_c0_seq10:318-1223(+)